MKPTARLFSSVSPRFSSLVSSLASSPLRAFALTSVLVACSADTTNRGGGGGPSKDLAFVFADVDQAGSAGTDDAGGALNACGDTDSTCRDQGKDPMGGVPFPLKSDPNPDPNVNSDGVGRDPNGWLGLDATHATFDFLWIANTNDWSRGTISKLNSKTIKEVARYFSVTCGSNPAGSKKACDGTTGCCSADDNDRWLARKGKMPLPPHQSVQLMSLSPSRTAIDFNGDLFVANRAFSGQSSVTKIANDLTECKDRNKNGKIDTSSDANGDGQIQTDCNANGTPDDLDDVKATPCVNGAKQEFFGLDDECVLWTTNTNIPNQYGRPLGLGQGAIDGGPSDAWAGTYIDGKFYRVDGTTALIKDEVKLPAGCQPYGLVIDADGYGWSPNLGSGPLCFFNTKMGAQSAQARNPQSGPMQGYGVALDRDQNVWIGGLGNPDAYRYTPDRSNKFANLGNGWWTKITGAGRATAGVSGPSYGVAADSRTPNLYFVWLATNSGHVVRMPGSGLPVMKMDQMIDGSMYPAAHVAGSNTRGCGLDRDQNIWGISNSGSVATRALVDAKGNITQPDINSAAAGNLKCPAGDRCPLKDNNSSDPQPYTYSDFTGFGLRNFTRPKGAYSYIVKGCVDGNGNPTDTRWWRVTFDSDVPPNTALTLHARTGKSPTPDASWGDWTSPFTASPADLRDGMPLQPFDMNDSYMQVEFVFSTMDSKATPKLKNFDVSYKCGIVM